MAWPSEAGAIASGTAAQAAIPAPIGKAAAKISPWRHSLTYTIERQGNAVLVTADSNLGPDGKVWYHWYVDGSYIASTTDNSHYIFLQADEQAQIEVVDTMDPDFDPVANAPIGYPARKTIFWYRSMESDIDYYRVDQKEGAGDWTEIGRVPHDDSPWHYSLLTPRLTDLTAYQWRVMPVDQAGNDGTATTYDAETVVRTPDAPDFTQTYDEDTDKITFAADT